MSTPKQEALQAKMRDWARQSLGAATPAELRTAAQALDTYSAEGQHGTYYATAETLRLLADETNARTATDLRMLEEACANAKAAEDRYEKILAAHRNALTSLCEAGEERDRLRFALTEQADENTLQAREIEALVVKLDRAEKRHTALGRVVLSVLEQITADGDVDIQFVYGDFGDDGIEPEVASDLGVGCVLGQEQRRDSDVLSQSGR